MTHDRRRLRCLADWVLVLDHGGVVATGAPGDVARCDHRAVLAVDLDEERRG